MTDSASSSFLYKRAMHSSRSTEEGKPGILRGSRLEVKNSDAKEHLRAG